MTACLYPASLLLFKTFCLANAFAAVENTLPAAPDPYLTAALSTQDGSIWIATEGKGIYRCTDGKTWQPMHTLPGYPATLNAYALAQDGTGAVWVGTDNRGLAVWNGTSWKQIAREHGLAGERIYSIATYRNHVAVATSGGISLYKGREWSHYTRADGMADDVASSLAFDDKGNLWAAYACGGIGILPRKGDYGAWLNKQAPWTFVPGQNIRQPLTATGTGLPSNLGNAMASSGPYTYCATSCGIARGDGKTWQYRRGRDYEAKNKGALPPSTSPPGTVTPPREQLLLEDYATALYPSEQGLWAGYREQGVQLLDPDTLEPKPAPPGNFNQTKAPRAKWVRQFVRLPGGSLYAATYGGGLRKVADLPAMPVSGSVKTLRPSHPFVPSIPTEKDIAAMIAKLEAGTPVEDPAFYWYEDWLTRGNWCERYGRKTAMLCAAVSPQNTRIDFGLGKPAPAIDGMIGPNRKKDDYLRLWFHTHDDHHNPNVLWNPKAGTRTEAEWDDHGEEYPMSQDGPDVWVKVAIPEGSHLLSLYFYNPNGRQNRNGYRDYLVELYTGEHRIIPTLADMINRHLYRPGDEGLRLAMRAVQEEEKRGENTISSLLKSGVVSARTRIFDFAGSGCWKNFVVRGPRTCHIRICRNNSFNTILNAVMLSPLVEYGQEERRLDRPATIYGYSDEPRQPEPPRNFHPADLPEGATRLWTLCRNVDRLSGKARYAARLSATACYRYIRTAAPPDFLRLWRWLLQLWTEESEKSYNAQMDAAWQSIQDIYIHCRLKEWRPYSPGVVPLTEEEMLYAGRNGIDWKQYRPGYKGTPVPSLEELKRKANPHKQP